MSLSRFLGQQVVFGIYKRSERMLDHPRPFVFPDKQLILLKELTVLIENLEVLHGLLDVVRIHIEVSIFVEDSDVKLQGWK